MTFAEFCEFIKSNPAANQEATRSRAALEAQAEQDKAEGKILPTFIPTFNLSEQSEHGHVVYTKAGLLSDSELLKWTSKKAKDLGLQPFTSEWVGPGNPVQFYIISLLNLPDELKATIKKVKLYQKTAVMSDKLWLTPCTQLSKTQPKMVHQHLAGKYQQGSRPTGLLSPTQLQSLADLKHLAELVESKRIELLHGDAHSAALAAMGEGGNRTRRSCGAI